QPRLEQRSVHFVESRQGCRRRRYRIRVLHKHRDRLCHRGIVHFCGGKGHECAEENATAGARRAAGTDQGREVARGNSRYPEDEIVCSRDPSIFLLFRESPSFLAHRTGCPCDLAVRDHGGGGVGASSGSWRAISALIPISSMSNRTRSGWAIGFLV